MRNTRVAEVASVREAGIQQRIGRFLQRLADPGTGERGNLWGYVFVAPCMGFYIVFGVWIAIRGLLMAFQDYRWLVPETQCLFCTNGLGNYRELIHDAKFWHSFWVSLKFSLIYLPTTLTLALVVAIMISRIEGGLLAAFYRVVVYLPVVLPISVAMLVWKQLFDPTVGYLNYFLRYIVGIRNPPYWFSWRWAFWTTMIPTIWRQFGYYTMLFLIGIYNISQELYEAAAIDGANAWQQHRYVTIPQLKPIFTLVLVLTAGLVSVMEEPMILFQGGGPLDVILTTGVYYYQTAFQLGDLRMGYAASMALILGIIHMALSGLVFKLMRTERA